MRIRSLLFFTICLFISLEGRTEGLSYTLSMDEPHKHFFKVEMNISDIKSKSIELKMPVWAPGSYMVREFARHVDFFTAKSGNKELKWYKTDKNTWKIETSGAKNIHVSYNVYAYEISVRTSFLDDSHGYVNGTSVFMYIKDKKRLSGQLEIIPAKTFTKVSTGLEKITSPDANTAFVYRFPDYDFLADCPIEIGNQTVFSFDAAGTEHEVALYGEGNYNVETLKKDMAKIVEECTKVFGENPNKRYVFIIHNLTVATGGLEHLNSTTLQVNRWTYSGAAYTSFLSLVAHEYFHLWNVKRLRADVLGPFDYDKENYTTLLWVLEGFTSYYDELLLRRSGFYSNNEFLAVLSKMINAVENTPGTKVQSAAESSFDAWIKGYRPHENSVNTHISYYTKGQVLGVLLDMEIMLATKGQHNLDDLMKQLYLDYFKKQNRGITATEFRMAAEKLAGKKLDTFFDEYVYKTTPIAYETYFKPMGLQLRKTDKKHESWLGAKLSDSNGKLTVKECTEGGSAYEGGLNVHDEIIACNGFRVNQNDLEKMIAATKPGDEMELLVARNQVIRTLKIKLLPNSVVDHQVTVLNQTDVNQEVLLKKWLGE